MNNFSLFFKLSNKFFKRYFKEYFKEILVPFILLVVSLLVIAVSVGLLMTLPAIGLVGSLVGLVGFIYIFWKVYLVCYALIPASYNFIKKGGKKPFKQIIKEINQKDLILFLAFCAVVYIIFLIITVIIAAITTAVFTPLKMPFMNIVATFLLVILIVPFINYSLQAYYFRKFDESFIDVFLDCYKKLNKEGILILIIATIVTAILNSFPLLALLNIVLVPYIYALFSFWYYSVSQKKG